MAFETFGLVLAVAGTFSSCVDAFGYFKAGQHLEEDYKISLVRLDIEKTRLLDWGNTVGILDDSRRHQMLEDQSKAELLKRCLESIETLLTNSEDLRKSYGVRASNVSTDTAIGFLSSNNMNIFRIAYARFRTRHALGNPRPTLASRVKWAIYEQAKFEKLINDLKIMIDGLYEIVPVDRQTQDNRIVADIGLIEDLSQLRLLDAASEGSYRAYSNAAKSVIATSEMGTVDHRKAEERIGDAEAFNHSGLADSSQSGGLLSTTALDSLLTEVEACKKQIVLTGRCQTSELGEPCEMAQLGAKCVVGDTYALNPYRFDVASGYAENGSALWQSVKRFINIRLKLEDLIGDSELMAKLLREESGQLDPHQREFLEEMLPVATAYIHCAPCLSLVHTALGISLKASSSFLRIAVRPDDRIPSSCCHDIDRTDGLRSILREIKRHESSGTFYTGFGYAQPPKAVRYLDRAWIEQRLYYVEQEQKYDVTEAASSFAIILGEAKHLLPLFQKAPGPRIPGEAEIWTLLYSGLTYQRKFLGSFTPKHLASPSIPSATRPTTVQSSAMSISGEDSDKDPHSETISE